MRFKSRRNYLRRIFEAYIFDQKSHLSFWHERPAINERAEFDRLGEYYMTFSDKTNYQGDFDKNGIPVLDYRGSVGKQYVPIAVAQYGLGHYNLYQQKNDPKNLNIATKQADWLVNNLKLNQKGVKVWTFNFDWEYRDILKSPWYSALAQGNGISLLLRIYQTTQDKKYLVTAQEAFEALTITVDKGGTLFIDIQGDYWLEETIVNPPTHILNGFLWTIWGVWDYYLATKEPVIKTLFDRCIKTLKNNLKNFDIGWWSLYEQSGTKMKMLASPFYHNLHIVQLKILYKITGETIFNKYAEKWEKYQKNRLYRNFALIYKIIFKVLYY